MRYKAKEVSRITGIPVDTLRYYEKIGVISPKIDDKNNYRYYSAWDINFLFEYLNFRKMEYSSKESIHFIHNASLEEQIKMAKEQRDFYQEKRNHYQMLTDRNNAYYEAIRNISYDLNKISIVNVPRYKYLLYRKNYDFFQSKLISKEIVNWVNQVGLTENVVIIPKEAIINQGKSDYYWGLMLRDDWFGKLNMEESERVHTIEPVTCIKTLVEAHGEGTFHYKLLDSAMKFLDDHNFELLGDPFGILLTRSHDDNRIHRYIEFYLPILLSQ